MYYVYYGYISPDSDFDSPTHKLFEFETKNGVLSLYDDYIEVKSYQDYCCVEFRVFMGEEKQIVPVEVIKAWELQ
jgi:hypothetical protein